MFNEQLRGAKAARSSTLLHHPSLSLTFLPFPSLPQNREVMMVSSGDGTLHLYKYHYPDQRRIKVCVCGAPDLFRSLWLWLSHASMKQQGH